MSIALIQTQIPTSPTFVRSMSEAQKEIADSPLLAVFGDFSPRELVVVSRVCKEWSKVAS